MSTVVGRFLPSSFSPALAAAMQFSRQLDLRHAAWKPHDWQLALPT
jgi:hypothetical protein